MNMVLKIKVNFNGGIMLKTLMEFRSPGILLLNLGFTIHVTVYMYINFLISALKQRLGTC